MGMIKLLIFLAVLGGVLQSSCSSSSPRRESSYGEGPLSEEWDRAEEDASAKKKRRRRRRRSSFRENRGGGTGSPPASSPGSPSSPDPGPPVPSCNGSPCVTNFCGRNPLVRQAILAQLPGGTTCDQVSEAHLAGITHLTIPYPSCTGGTVTSVNECNRQRSYGGSRNPVKADDLKNLSGLTHLSLNRHSLSTPHPNNFNFFNFFSDLTALEELNLDESGWGYFANIKRILSNWPKSPLRLTKLITGTDTDGTACTREPTCTLPQSVLNHLGASGVNCPSNCRQYNFCECTLTGTSLVISTLCPGGTIGHYPC